LRSSKPKQTKQLTQTSDSYVKELEDQIEQLQQKLAECEVRDFEWCHGPNQHQMHLHIGKCFIAQYFKSANGKTWNATVYNTQKNISEYVTTEVKTAAQAKKWIMDTIYGR
jgi:hypothetical protein